MPLAAAAAAAAAVAAESAGSVSARNVAGLHVG